MEALQDKDRVSRRSGVLNDDEGWLVSQYVFLLAVPGLICGLVWESQVLIMVASFLFGLYVSPWAPIWKKATTSKDHNSLLIGRAGAGKFFRIWYWAFPAVTLLLLLLGAISHFLA